MADNYVSCTLVAEELVQDCAVEAVTVQVHLHYTTARLKDWRPVFGYSWDRWLMLLISKWGLLLLHHAVLLRLGVEHNYCFFFSLSSKFLDLLCGYFLSSML